MTANGILQLVLYFGILLLLVKPLGTYIYSVMEGQPTCRGVFHDGLVCPPQVTGTPLQCLENNMTSFLEIENEIVGALNPLASR